MFEPEYSTIAKAYELWANNTVLYKDGKWFCMDKKVTIIIQLKVKVCCRDCATERKLKLIALDTARNKEGKDILG